MAYRIGLIASDWEMKNRVEALYPEQLAQGRLITVILDNDRIEEQGRWLEAQGVDLIIGRSGGYERNVGNVRVPLLRMRIRTADIFEALIEASRKGDLVELFLWDQVHFDTSWFDFLPCEVTVHWFSTGGEIAGLFEEAMQAHPEGVVVGGGVVSLMARERDMPWVFINSSVESIEDTFTYALELLEQLDARDYQRELMGTTLDNVHDAVIAVDRQGVVRLFSERAQDILRIGTARALGRPLIQLVPELAFIIEDLKGGVERKEQLLQLGPTLITYSTSKIEIGGEMRSLLFTFQDITRLQMLEQNIRRELNKKGMVARHRFDDIICVDALMREVVEKAKVMGRSDSTVVIYGESGTGKEVIAQSLHTVSCRAGQPFVAINCAALSENLLESELFGYEEGAFTGARKGGKPGLFEQAHGGTIFLDEINSISAALQGKLLRVIEEKEVMRIGSDYVIPLDVRILCAANEDLKAMVRQGTFRSDLFYRLNSLELQIPPLRERREDILPLFRYFLGELELDELIQWPGQEQQQQLIAYHWPGNVRELRNVVERYHLFGTIELDAALEEETLELSEGSIDLKEIHHLVEDRLIGQLIRSGMSKTEIADKLGISRTALWKKMNR